MLSITIFSTMMGDMLPVSDATPLIGQHFNTKDEFLKYFKIYISMFILSASRILNISMKVLGTKKSAKSGSWSYTSFPNLREMEKNLSKLSAGRHRRSAGI